MNESVSNNFKQDINPAYLEAVFIWSEKHSISIRTNINSLFGGSGGWFLVGEEGPQGRKIAQDYFHVQNKTKISIRPSYPRVYQTVVIPNKRKQGERKD
jgi:hypothetical protein